MSISLKDNVIIGKMKTFKKKLIKTYLCSDNWATFCGFVIATNDISKLYRVSRGFSATAELLVDVCVLLQGCEYHVLLGSDVGSGF